MNILIITATPADDLQNYKLLSKLADSYEKGAKEKGSQVLRLFLSDNIPISNDAIHKMAWADHLVLVFPLISSYPPALLVAFFEKLFSNEKVLRASSARLIMLDTRPEFLSLFNSRHPAVVMMKKKIMDLAPLSTVTVSIFRLKNNNNFNLEKNSYHIYREALDEN